MLVAQTLIVAALTNRRTPEPEEPGAPPALAPAAMVVTLALTAGLALWWGLFPGALARLIGVAPTGVFGSVFSQIANAGILGLITVILPFILGLVLARNDERLFASLRGWQDTVAHIASLDWAYSGASRLSQRLGAALAFLPDLVDGAGQFGWALLILLAAWVLLGGLR